MNSFSHRYIARIILEATTPLFVGSGQAGFLTDAMVRKDHNGLPLIPGTSLAGVFRHSLEDYNKTEINWREVFGYQERDNGVGSKIRISDAYFLIAPNTVIEGVGVAFNPVVVQKMANLPSRQHVKINDKGAAVEHNLFDNEVVYAGSRFLFELVMQGTGNDEDNGVWNTLLDQLMSPLFRIGQGTRKGYGKLRVCESYSRIFDLRKNNDFIDFSNWDPSLNAPIPFQASNKSVNIDGNSIHYHLKLTPDSFFIFSKGAGDDEVDNVPVEEEVIIYRPGNAGQLDFEMRTLIPASSIKGAIAHRTCYHFNKAKNKFADDNEGILSNANEAVYSLFGLEGGAEDNDRTPKRGNVILDDLLLKNVSNDKILNHVAIDRFTGGAFEGALFSEKVSRMDAGDELEIDLFLTNKETISDEDVVNSFEESLKDICKGLLPLGGMGTKGHGVFTGTIARNDETIFEYKR